MREKIKKELIALSDNNYKEFSEKIVSNTANILGVRMPMLKKYAKELLAEHEIKELIQNIDSEYHEEILLKGIIIGSEKDPEKTKQYIKDYVPLINNWATCDSFCSNLKIIKKNKNDFWNFIQSYLKSNKTYEIRFGVVILLNYYIEKERLEEIFEILKNIKSERYYVQMAVAWALSVCLVKFYDETYGFLKNNKLSKFVLLKTISKANDSYRLSAEQKQKLKELRRC